MTTTYDAIVLGLGGFGSAALCHLARRGMSVLGIDRFGIAHDRGSSHGETRIIRKAYFEHPSYVPLLKRAYELWAELERASGQSLYQECGLFFAGPPEGEVVSGTLKAARLHAVRVDELTLTEARERFSLFHFADSDAVVFEPEAGYLRVEACVAVHVNEALRAGAAILTDEPVVTWSAAGPCVRVVTDKQSYESAKLVIAAGAWSAHLLRELSLPLTVKRKLMFWHKIDSPAWGEATAFFFERPEGCFYGFPSLDGQTVKVAEHTQGQSISDPLTLDQECHAADYEPVSHFVSQTMRGVSTQPCRHMPCMYTMTPDGHFIVDRHPKYENVILGTGFSGHGFKFTSVIGEAMADLASDGSTSLPIEFMRLARSALSN